MSIVRRLVGCGAAALMLALASLGRPAAAGAGGKSFEACGTLHFNPGGGIMCIALETAGGSTFTLSTIGDFGFGDGDVVCVTGALDPKAVPFCKASGGFVTVASIHSEDGTIGGRIDPGGGGPKPTPFDGCGTLDKVVGGGISILTFDTHTGSIYVLQGDIGKFRPGDEVCITGTQIECFIPPFLIDFKVAACVTIETITADPGSKTSIVNECGTFTAPGTAGGSKCTLFHAGTGAIYSVTGTIPTGLAGKSVHLNGVVKPGGDQECGPVDGGIHNPEIVLCGDLNHDTLVNGLDLALLLAAWGPCAGCGADLNGDSHVTGVDLAMQLASWAP